MDIDPPPDISTNIDRTKAVRLLDLINIDILQKLQDTFAEATGVASIITYPNGEPLTKASNFSQLCRDIIRKTPIGLKKCMYSDSIIGRPNPDEPNIQPCLSCGLWDGGASIFAGDTHVANWLVGQVRNESVHESKIRDYAHEIGVDEGQMLVAFRSTTFMPIERFRAICDFLFNMANQLSSLAYEKLFQQQIQQTLERGKRLQALGQLSGGIAHDFNNILTVILGNVELMKIDFETHEIDPKTAIDQLTEIQDVSNRAVGLVRQLLAFSRQQLSLPKPTDINLLVKDIQLILKRFLPESIVLKIELEEPIPDVKIDRSQFDQVILNLVLNARDAMPNGGELWIETSCVHIDREFVSRHPESREGKFVRFAVIDNGIGMKNEVIEHLFEPFFTTKPIGMGTGLGLATVFGIVKQAAGFIIANSEFGKGSKFQIFLPTAEGLESQNPESVNGGLDFSLDGTETILLVEDSEPILRLAEKILQNAGYSVISAKSGEDAIEVVGRLHPHLHLLITDVILPGINGKELAGRLKNEFLELQVLFCSGYTADILTPHGVLQPEIDFLEKPYSRVTLLNAVRKALNS